MKFTHWTIAIVILLSTAIFYESKVQLPKNEQQKTIFTEQSADNAIAFAQAFKQRQSNVQLKGEGRIKRLLPDDNNGSRHQRFLVQLANNQNLLIAHNIDLAQPIQHLHEGEIIQFYGEYEWNEKGGVIHWTHKDPRGQHINGWVKYRGDVYQ
jgi:Protein of unknown function (DUF3465)